MQPERFVDGAVEVGQVLDGAVGDGAVGLDVRAEFGEEGRLVVGGGGEVVEDVGEGAGGGVAAGVVLVGWSLVGEGGRWGREREVMVGG